LAEETVSNWVEQLHRGNNMDLQLKNRTCLITGSSQGIGIGTARVMAAEGWRYLYNTGRPK